MTIYMVEGGTTKWRFLQVVLGGVVPACLALIAGAVHLPLSAHARWGRSSSGKHAVQLDVCVFVCSAWRRQVLVCSSCQMAASTVLQILQNNEKHTGKHHTVHHTG